MVVGSLDITCSVYLTNVTPSQPEVVDVWVAPLDPDLAAVGDGAGLLDAEELARAGRFRSPADRRRFVAAHAGLRFLLGARLGIDPAAVVLARDPCPLCGGPHGRPVVVGAPGLEVSMSHTDGMVAYALTPCPVGIDAEAVGRAVSLDDLEVGLHPAESAAIARLHEAERRPAALRCWVRKEAYLKGIGTGLGLDPATVEVGLGGAEGWGPGPDGWWIADLTVGPGHVAAVAVAPGGPATPPVEVRLSSLRQLAAGALSSRAPAPSPRGRPPSSTPAAR